MYTGDVALSEFYHHISKTNGRGATIEHTSNVSVVYKIGSNKQILQGCDVYINLQGSEWKISVYDPNNLLVFNEFVARYQDFSFDESTGTFKIKGTDTRNNKAKIPYSISMTI